MTQFTGKVALITGASKGIGRAVAMHLAELGAEIVVNHRRSPVEAEATAAAIRDGGRRALVVQADVADRQQVAAMYETAVNSFGHIDIIVANAASSIHKPVIELTWAEARHTLEVCQFGVVHTCQLGAQQLVKQAEAGRHGGKIVIISSIHAEFGFANCAPYNMAKASMRLLGEHLALELAPHQINVNVINPGWILTEGEREQYAADVIAERGSRIPWGRLGTPQEMAQVVAFLASDAASYITGSVLRADGGFSVGLHLIQPETANAD